MKSLILMLFLFTPFISIAANSDMQANSCAPNGFTNNIKEKLDPKSFWSTQFRVAGDMVLYWIAGVGAGEEGAPQTVRDCVIEHKNDSIARQECITHVRGEINFWRRCGKHAQKMCRLHGGYC